MEGRLGQYPANDIDWLAFVNPYSVLTKKGDEFQLRIGLDGKVLSLDRH